MRQTNCIRFVSNRKIARCHRDRRLLLGTAQVVAGSFQLATVLLTKARYFANSAANAPEKRMMKMAVP